MTSSTRPSPPAEAAREGDADTLRRALADGRDVDERDEHGWNALDWAAGRGDLGMIKTLLAAGASPVAAEPDGRTAYRTAVSAGHREAARILRTAMRETGGEAADTRWRPYCRAYLAAELAAFPGWPARTDPPAGPQDVLYVHDDLTVTRNIWPGEDVVHDQVTPEWQNFCHERLNFAVPDDLDLLP